MIDSSSRFGLSGFPTEKNEVKESLPSFVVEEVTVRD